LHQKCRDLAAVVGLVVEKMCEHQPEGVFVRLSIHAFAAQGRVSVPKPAVVC
jgi:hypothetical protein